MGLRAFLIAAIFLLSGCAGVEYRNSNIQSSADGGLLFRLLPNTLSASFYFANWQDITVARLPSRPGEREQKFAVSAKEEGGSRTAIYAGWLPPGTYRIVNFSSRQCGAICIDAQITVNPQFSKFEIQTGHLTDLGVLVQTDVPSKDQGTLLSLGNPPAVQDTEELVDQLVPGFRALLSSPLLYWKEDTVSPKMPVFAEYAKVASFGLSSPTELSDGSFLYGSANGVVFQWTPGAGTVGHDVGTNSAVESLLVTSGGSWLAGGELGMLRQSDDHGVSWHSVRGNIPLGVVVDLYQWRNKVVATTVRGSRVWIHSADLDSSEWEQLAQYVMIPHVLTDPFGVEPESFLVGDRLVTSLPGRRVANLDLVAGTSEISSLPGSIQSFSVSTDGVLRCWCVPTMIVDYVESRDFGKTWSQAGEARYVSAYRDNLHGVSFKGPLPFSPARMMYTHDGGASWIDSTEMPLYIKQVFYSRDQKTAYAVTAYGTLWSSSNDGRSWARVRR